MNLAMLRRLLIIVSGGALLFAMAVDVIAMFGRQFRLPLPGSIELVEVAVLFAAAGALVIATADDSHAKVNLVAVRLPATARVWLDRFHVLAGVMFFAALLTGTVWIAADLWSGHEESELLHLPYRPLRVATALALAGALALSLLRKRKDS